MPITNLVDDILNHIYSYLKVCDIGIIKNNNIFKKSTYCKFATLGYINILKWITADVLESVKEHFILISNGHIRGYADPYAYRYNVICTYAAQYGHLDIIQWMYESGKCKLDTHMCSFAAIGNQLEALRWLRANGCPWDANVCAFAARNCYLDILQWAHDNGCECDYEADIVRINHYIRRELNKSEQANKQLIAKYNTVLDWLNKHNIIDTID